MLQILIYGVYVVVALAVAAIVAVLFITRQPPFPFPDGPSPFFFFQNAMKADSDPTKLNPAVLLPKLHEQYGSWFTMRLGVINMISVADPAICEEINNQPEKFDPSLAFKKTFGLLHPKSVIVVTGDEWKRIRKLIMNAFHRYKLKPLFKAIAASTFGLASKWEGLVNGSTDRKAPIPILWDIQKTLLDAFGGFVYGVDFGSMQGRNLDLLKTASTLFARVNDWTIVPYDWMKKLPLPMNNVIWETSDKLKAFAKKLYEDRLAAIARGETQHEDFLQALIDARDEESSEDKLTYDEIIDQLVILLFAAFDTGANTLTFALSHLASHPDAQEKVFQEVKQVIPHNYEDPTSGFEWSFDLMGKLKHTEWAVKESQRLIPTALGVPRTAKEDIEINGRTFPKGALFLLNGSVMSRDPKNWNTTADDIEQYRPDRWADQTGFSRIAFVPFGVGHRMCVGYNVATVELKLMVALLLRKFKITRQEKDIDVFTSVTTAPKDPNLAITFELRNE